jgi:hypothetical protein
MEWSEEEKLEMINQLRPKILKALKETNPQHRDDLEQDLIEFILKKLNDPSLDEIPGLFEFLNEK